MDLKGNLFLFISIVAMFLDSFENEFHLISSGALAHIDTLHVDWHLSDTWQVRTETLTLLELL